MAMHYVVFSALQLRAQRTNEGSLLCDRHGRKQDAGPQRGRLRIENPELRQGAIEGPVDVRPAGAGVPQHPHQPVLHRTAVETFDNV